MLCFRLLHEADPANSLLKIVESIKIGAVSTMCYKVDPPWFIEIPDAPFAYWSSKKTRAIFKSIPTFVGDGRTVKQGLATGDDFRFVRYRWEVRPDEMHRSGWCPFVRASGYSPFYTRLNYLVGWGDGGRELRFIGDSTGRHPRSRLRGTDYYFRPGITWPLRGSIFSGQVVPKGCIFSIAGKLAIVDDESELPSTTSIVNSRVFDYLIGYYAGNVSGTQYEVGLIGGTPLANPDQHQGFLEVHFKRAWLSKKNIDSRALVSPAFHAPALAPGRKPTTC